MSLPLRGPTVLLLALLTVGGIEGATRLGYRTRDGLGEKAAKFAHDADSSHPNLVILGTCLPEQHILGELLADRMGGGWEVHNLGNQATSPLDWYLALAHELPLDRIQGLVIAHGRRDLITQISPWESRVMDVATWSDVPSLLRYACDDLECRTDLVLRKASTTWRYRVRLANRAWASVGALAREAPVLPPPPTEADVEAPLHFLGRLLETASGAGIPVWMVPLPTRPGAGGDPAQRAFEEKAYHAWVDPVLQAGGARPLELPALPAAAFADDSHLNGDGAAALTRALAAALRAELDLEEPPEAPAAASGPQGPALGPGSAAPAGPHEGRPQQPASASPGFLPPPDRPQGPPLP